jgi:hypothetical protein
MKEASPATVTLTDRQILVLNAVMQQSFFSIENAANFAVNPRPVLLSNGLSEGDVDNIVAYFNAVAATIKIDHGDDW